MAGGTSAGHRAITHGGQHRTPVADRVQDRDLCTASQAPTLAKRGAPSYTVRHHVERQACVLVSRVVVASLARSTMSQQRNEDTVDGVAKGDTFDGVGKRDTLDAVGKRDTFQGVGKRDTFNGTGKRDSAGRTGRGADVPDFPDLPEATVARLPEFLRHHVIGIGTKPGAPQRGIRRILLRPAPAAQCCTLKDIADSRRGERRFQHFAGEMRMAA